MENLEPPAMGMYALLFDILFLLVCECFKYDHCIHQSHPTTELTYRVPKKCSFSFVDSNTSP